METLKQVTLTIRAHETVDGAPVTNQMIEEWIRLHLRRQELGTVETVAIEDLRDRR